MMTDPNCCEVALANTDWRTWNASRFLTVDPRFSGWGSSKELSWKREIEATSDTVELGSSVCPRKEREAISRTRFRMASLASVVVVSSPPPPPPSPVSFISFSSLPILQQ